MDRFEKMLLAKSQLADLWRCDVSAFDSDKNVFIETTDTFFEIKTSWSNAVIRADRKILKWCCEHFSAMPARDIMDGDNLFLLETKHRSMGKKLAGEHIRYPHLFSERTLQVSR